MNNKPEEYRDDDLEQPRPVIEPGGIAGYGRKISSSFRNPVYRLYYYSLVGHWAPLQMQMQARTLLIYRITDSGQLLGTMALAGSIPMLILSLYGGALADRLDKRKVLIVGQSSSAVLALAVALALSFGKPIIAPKLGCLIDILDEMGAFLYHAREKDGLLKALKESIIKKDTLSKMGKYNIEKVKNVNWTCHVGPGK